ncbi:peptidase domain-containing ABC transporter [Ktedonosporobacter rubrisoli]|uniref:peptidase domain-containing ABC transporter n=1 Tax=Ktedonosporobacter rubrisoli TaxID=2509675 RepID=UPI003BF46DD5
MSVYQKQSEGSEASHHTTEIGQKLSGRLKRKHVPLLSQMSRVECGLACLAMVLSYYGRKTSISEIRTQCGVGRDGLSALGIVRAARRYKMRVRAVSLQHSDLRYVPLPAIVHWEFKHFLVVENWTSKFVDVVDPAHGRQRLTSEEFDAGFTGVVITLEPGTSFEYSSDFKRLSLSRYLFEHIKQMPLTLIQVLFTSLLLQGLGLVLPLLNKVVLDQIIPAEMSNLMFLLGVGMLMLVLSQAVTTLLRGLLLVYLRARIDKQMIHGFFERLLMLPYSFFQQRSSGDLLARVNSNTIIRDTLSSQLIATLLDSGMVVLYLFILLWQSLPFGIITLIIGFLQIALLLATKRPMAELAHRELAAQGRSQGYMAEALVGIATLKAAGVEDRALARWSNLFFEQLNTSLHRNYLSTLIDSGMNALRTLAPLALLWMGTMQVLNHTMSAGTMFALNALAISFLTPLSSLVTSGLQLQIVPAHFERLTDVTMAGFEQDREKVQSPPRLSGHICLRNVSFQYDQQAPKILQNINLEIKAGQKVALVGRTGSGKSTLGKLLLGLYMPTEGEILYDGIPLQNMNYQEVRQQFGVVMQDNVIFSGSILQNVTLSDPEAKVDRVTHATRIAGIHEDIMKMPMGYETFVSEGGSALSGGQRQRVAIARAIVHNPVILLLDEATSHLDVITEHKVEQQLATLSCTQIIIAHRLSTIRDADVIIVIDRGTIVEKGSHEELMRLNGYYTRLMQHQHAEKGPQEFDAPANS